MTSETTTASSPLLTVIGEALIDLVPNGVAREYRALVGGSPYNVAVGLARLGNRTQLLARIGDNAFGQILREHARDEGIDLSAAPHAVEPTSLAVVTLGADAKVSYDFYLAGTADWQWTAAELARLSPATAVLHFGSIASWTVPGSAHIHAAIAKHHARGNTLISYDPNIRPALIGDPAHARTMIEESVRCAHIVKASREDLDWLYPNTPVAAVAAQWQALGPALVIITDGFAGAIAFQCGAAPIHRPSRRVTVADTIGAGDAFTAGLLSSIAYRGLVTPEALRRIAPDILVDALDKAILVAALTCERIGADPPRGNFTKVT